jgi:hypothetical protein
MIFSASVIAFVIMLALNGFISLIQHAYVLRGAKGRRTTLEVGDQGSSHALRSVAPLTAA